MKEASWAGKDAKESSALYSGRQAEDFCLIRYIFFRFYRLTCCIASIAIHICHDLRNRRLREELDDLTAGNRCQHRIVEEVLVDLLLVLQALNRYRQKINL